MVCLQHLLRFSSQRSLAALRQSPVETKVVAPGALRLLDAFNHHRESRRTWYTLQSVITALSMGVSTLAMLQCNPPLKCDGPAPAPASAKATEEDWFTNPSLCSDASSLWRRKWNPDWDGRAAPTIDSSTDKTTADKKAAKAPGKVRHLLFIRHGQYDLDSQEKGLTELGREQSRLLGLRLAAEAKGLRKDRYGEVKVKYAGIWSSDVTRAKQTAEIISSILEGVPRQESDPILAEGRPTVPHPCSKNAKIRSADIWEESARLEAAFRKYIHRDVDQKRHAEKLKKEEKKEEKKRKELGDGYVPGDEHKAEKSEGKNDEKSSEPEHSYEIIVCHMNVIRYFTLRALQLPPEAWLRLRGDNTGVTEIVVYPDGRVSLYRFADVGHLPIEKITFH
eukprot:TRINITY_DN4855_c0_g1_i1.p1 TRINITY_DN4855_c0_g1~~TRINITY_DN4855_c0_g1_i1.p1  ORF type:complete len:393 (+),score=77.46 TRINITY_DN4855_c0_g1_i1:143-1321(+)